MKKLNYSIDIQADKDSVWKALWEDANYRQWTSVFFEGSHALTDNWKEGSIVHFLTPQGDGMYSRIIKHIQGEQMTFEHIGNVVRGEEQPQDETTKSWSGMREEYFLQANGDNCRLEVQMDTTDDFAGYMDKTFPKALEMVKKLSESS